MSYVLNVWEQPVPDSLQEADRVHEQLSRDPQRLPRPKLDDLAKALWQRYPRDVGNDAVDPVWADDSLRRPHDGSALLNFGVVTHHLDAVVPFVAEMAAARGLVVYDLQYGTVYLPGGRVLGILPPQRTAVSETEPMTPPEAFRAIRDALESALEPLGFSWRPKEDGSGVFALPFDGGAHEIAFGVDVRSEGAAAFIYAASHLDAIDAVVHGAGVHPAGHPLKHTIISLADVVQKALPEMMPKFQFHPHDRKFIFPRRSDVVGICRDLGVVVQRVLRPMLGRYETVNSYWTDAFERSEAQGGEPWPSISVKPAIVAGRLVGDPRHMELARREASRVSQDLAASHQDLKRSVKASESLFQDFREFVNAVVPEAASAFSIEPATIAPPKSAEPASAGGSVQLPLLPLRDLEIKPGSTASLFVGRPASLAALKKAVASDKRIFVVTQRVAGQNKPVLSDLHEAGTIAEIREWTLLPDGTCKILIAGLEAARLIGLVDGVDHLSAQVVV